MLLPKISKKPVFLFETLLKTYKDLLTPDEKQQSTDVCRVSGESILVIPALLSLVDGSFHFPIVVFNKPKSHSTLKFGAKLRVPNKH